MKSIFGGIYDIIYPCNLEVAGDFRRIMPGKPEVGGKIPANSIG
jgi:hypothetical protein